MNDTSKAIIPHDSTLLKCLQTIDKLETQFVILTNHNLIVKGVLSDGDIRRALIKGATLNESALKYSEPNFIRVSPDVSRATALDLMKINNINYIPIVDNELKYLGVHIQNTNERINNRDITAVIMAGGKGERLLSYTKNMPKPMLNIAGRPILERIIYHFVSHGIEKIFISVGYLSEIITKYFGNGEKHSCDIEYIHEPKPLGTGGSLGYLAETISDTFIVMNGDIISDVNFNLMISTHISKKNLITIGINPHHHQLEYGYIQQVDNGNVSIIEKPTFTYWVNSGIYVMNKSSIAHLKIDEPTNLTDIIKYHEDKAMKIGSYKTEGNWIDIGIEKNFIMAQKHF